MQCFRVAVNGVNYNIEVEEISKGMTAKERNGQVSKPSVVPQLAVVPTNRKEAPKEAPKVASKETPKEAPKEAAKEASKKNGGNAQIVSPMPGMVGEIMKVAGDSVAAGETIMLLEAMKLENDIVAPKDGVIGMLYVSTGQGVNVGDLLAEID
ncbi:glutaconyl-CoA decarboxylase subunit gamma [Peptococcaceae bacterium CEB3]|nr:glutaconyl-CoA decarboxylase subunit gamma [Peptococcaceae bacterium CEB3]